MPYRVLLGTRVEATTYGDGVHAERSRHQAAQVYGARGIAREDHEGRTEVVIDCPSKPSKYTLRCWDCVLTDKACLLLKS